MGSVNSQISRTMGFMSSGGNGFDAMAYGAGGMRAMEGVAVASTALNTAMTAVNTITNVTGVGGRVMNMARGAFGSGEAVTPVSQVDIGMSNLSVHTSIARKGAMDSIANISRQIRVQQKYEGNLPSNNSAWGQFPSGGNGGGGGSPVGGGI